MRARFTRRGFVGATLLASASPATLRGAPTVFPTGTTIYDPDKAWNGFTVLSTLDTPAVLVIAMNGRTVKRWDGFAGPTPSIAPIACPAAGSPQLSVPRQVAIVPPPPGAFHVPGTPEG